MKKNLSVLIVLLIVLVAAWWWLGTQEESRQRGDVPEQATQVDTLTLDRMVLVRHNQPKVVFRRDAGGVWQMTEPVQDRAAENFVKQMERGLATLKYIDKVSSRESQHASFQIDDVQAARLTAYAGEDVQADLYIGKITPDLQHVYIRPVGSSTVYTATGGGAMSALRTRATDDFRNRAIFNRDATIYDSVDVQGQEAVYRVARSDTASWRIRVGNGPYQEAYHARVGAFVRALANMNATGFAGDSTVINWETPLLTVRAWRLDGGVDVFHFQKVTDENNYWLRVEGRPFVYKMFESAYKTFERDVTELLPSEAGAS